MQEKVEHMMQFVSVDAYGKRAEYIRDGLDFDRMMDNVEEFLDRIPARNSITFICTYNNLSITSMDRLLEKILDLRKRYSKTYQRVWFDVPLLRQPAWQQITLLPEAYQSIHEANIEYMQNELRRGKRATHIQGLRDPEDAEESRILARKRGRKYAKQKKLLRFL